MERKLKTRPVGAKIDMAGKRYKVVAGDCPGCAFFRYDHCDRGYDRHLGECDGEKRTDGIGVRFERVYNAKAFRPGE